MKLNTIEIIIWNPYDQNEWGKTKHSFELLQSVLKYLRKAWKKHNLGSFIWLYTWTCVCFYAVYLAGILIEWSTTEAELHWAVICVAMQSVTNEVMLLVRNVFLSNEFALTNLSNVSLKLSLKI